MTGPRNAIHQGDALAALKTLPAESVHCCITSPPYFALRDYGTAQWEGGDPGCDHEASLRPALILTTALVAARAGRDWLGIELSPAYVEMAERRLGVVRNRLL